MTIPDPSPKSGSHNRIPSPSPGSESGSKSK